MADYNNEHDVYIPAKGIGVSISGSKSLDGAPIYESGEKITSGALRLDYRMDTETSVALLTGLIKMYPSTANAVLSNVTASEDNDLAARNGTKLSLHIGSRTSKQYGRVFNAGIGFLKPLQDAPGAAGRKGKGNAAKNSMKKAVGGDVESPEAFRKQG